MKRKIPGLALAILIALSSSVARAQTAVEKVADQFRAYCLHESTDHGARILDDAELPKTNPNDAEKLVGSMKDDGSWADVDYASNAKSSWPPCTHLTRALGLIVYARRSDTPAADSAECLAAVHRALAYWKLHDYQCPNWWYNQIGDPKILGDIALLLGKDLTADERDYIANVALARAKIGTMTGQNRVWLAANGVMRAAILSDDAMMKQASAVIAEEIRTGTGEGIQPDWSFQQHGAQQQFGNYGMACAVEMTRWATVLRGTPWAFSNSQMEVLRDYLLEGQNWVSWRGEMDISACGRQLFPGSPASKAAVIAGAMRTMAVADDAHAADYLAFVARNQPSAGDDAANDLVGDRYFWRSDYLVHRGANFMSSLKMSSDRVIGGETVNNENLSGLHLADGATYFYRTGHEYDDIFPAWDWRMVPGVTSSLDEASLHWPTPDLKKGSDFVGAVSDGENSSAAMDFHRDDLRAKKAWFFTGDAVICLGAGIDSTGAAPVVTTLNQCLLKTAVIIQRAGKRESISGVDQNLQGVDWVEQDGLRYTPLQVQTSLQAQPPIQAQTSPQAPTLMLSAASRTGNWRKVFDSPATPPADVTKDVFTIWIAHGAHVTGGSYAYSVIPAIDFPPTEQGAGIEILSNTSALQAVRAHSRTGTVMAAVFWSAGSADLNGLKVKVDSPCLMLVDSSKVFISDPTQKLRNLNIEIAGDSTIVNLPSGGDAGKSVEAISMR